MESNYIIKYPDNRKFILAEYDDATVVIHNDIFKVLKSRNKELVAEEFSDFSSLCDALGISDDIELWKTNIDNKRLSEFVIRKVIKHKLVKAFVPNDLTLKQPFPSDLAVYTDEHGDYIKTIFRFLWNRYALNINLYRDGKCKFTGGQNIPEAESDYVIKTRTKFGISTLEHVEENDIFCNSYNHLTSHILAHKEAAGLLENYLDEKGRCLSYLFRNPSYGKVVLDVDLVAYIKEQQKMGNWDDRDDRIVSLKTGDNTYSWYKYNSIRNEFKLIKGSEHSIESEYHDYDEWLRNQMEKAIREIELSQKEYIKDVETSAKVTYLDVANLSKDNEDTAVETSKQSTLSIDNLRCKFANYAEIGEGHKRRHKELTLTCNSVKFIVNTDSGELVQVDNEVRYDSILNYLSTFCTSEEQAADILKDSSFEIRGRVIDARRVYQ